MRAENLRTAEFNRGDFRDMTMADIEKLADRLPWGTPAEVADKLIKLAEHTGASTVQVISMITKNYLWLALIAAAIAFPVAGYFMHNWLNVFTYNTGLTVIPFIISALVIVVTAAATAMFHSAKAAWTKPAKILRAE